MFGAINQVQSVAGEVLGPCWEATAVVFGMCNDVIMYPLIYVVSLKPFLKEETFGLHGRNS